MPMGGTTACPICGKPYKWYSLTVADQSACPECVYEAEQSVSRTSNDRERERRRRFFNNEGIGRFHR